MLNKYNNLIYQPVFVSYSDFMNNKNEEIHRQLYDSALSAFLEEHPQYQQAKIKEINCMAYWLPSSIYINGNTFSLESYWNNEYITENIIKKDFKTYIDQESLPDIKIKYIDYIKNTVTVFSRYTGKEYTIPFSQANNYTIDPDYTLSNTFYNKHITNNK